jgi:hypothetical protein
MHRKWQVENCKNNGTELNTITGFQFYYLKSLLGCVSSYLSCLWFKLYVQFLQSKRLGHERNQTAGKGSLDY